MEYLNDMKDSYKNIDEYKPGEKCKLIIYSLMILLMIWLLTKTLNLTVTELFYGGKKTKFWTVMTLCSRYIWITNSNDHIRVWTANLCIRSSYLTH